MFRVASLVVVGCLFTTAAASAQGNPRDFERPGPQELRQMYFAQTRTEANEMLIRWKRAWDDDDAAALSKFYAPDASYLPPASAPVQTREAIRDHLAGILATAGDVQVRMETFGTSGDLAYLTARMSHEIQGTAGQPTQVVRTDVLVLRRHLNAWQIEMHFSRDEAEAMRR